MWKKKWLCVVLVLCAVMLSACQQKETFSTEAPTNVPAADTQAQDLFSNAVVDSAESDFEDFDYDDGSYDPSQEEDEDSEDLDEGGMVSAGNAVSAVTMAPTMYSDYAGATPVLIDPIDKPTATPLPPITFTYSTYTASALHITFDGPTGWTVDDTQSDTYMLTDPDGRVDYAANMTLREVPVNRNYSKNDLNKEVKGMLDTLKSSGLKNFSPSNTATHSFLKSEGVYAAYTATTADGVKIAGRVMVACVNKNLYVLHTSYPQGYATEYKDGLFNKVRQTAKIAE